MIFKSRFLTGIKQGSITLAFRRWKKPTVKSNGSLMTAVGQLEIKSVTKTDLTSISEADARSAGYVSSIQLIEELSKRKEGSVYRIELGELRADPRIALRRSPLEEEEISELKQKLQRIDARAKSPWTTKVLQIIESNPAVRAADLCLIVNQEKMSFKNNVRKLKNLGSGLSPVPKRFILPGIYRLLIQSLDSYRTTYISTNSFEDVILKGSLISMRPKKMVATLS